MRVVVFPLGKALDVPFGMSHTVKPQKGGDVGGGRPYPANLSSMEDG